MDLLLLPFLIGLCAYIIASVIVDHRLAAVIGLFVGVLCYITKIR